MAHSWVPAVRGQLEQLTQQMTNQNSHMLRILENQDHQLAAMEQALQVRSSSHVTRVPATNSSIRRILIEISDLDTLVMEARTQAMLLRAAADSLERSSSEQPAGTGSLQSGLDALAELHQTNSAAMKALERIRAALRYLEESPQVRELSHQLEQQQVQQLQIAAAEYY